MLSTRRTSETHFALQLPQPSGGGSLPFLRYPCGGALVRHEVDGGALPVLCYVGSKNDGVLVHGYNVGVADAVLVLDGVLYRDGFELTLASDIFIDLYKLARGCGRYFGRDDLKAARLWIESRRRLLKDFG